MRLPAPYPGMVINYGYLWAREAAASEAGRKERPCVVFAVDADRDGEQSVFVAPVTHTAPLNPEEAIELPPATRRRLGLDDKPCWLMCSEVNEFTWPGIDLKRIPHHEPRSCIYGALPHKIMEQARERLEACSQKPAFQRVPRDNMVAPAF